MTGFTDMGLLAISQSGLIAPDKLTQEDSLKHETYTICGNHQAVMEIS